MLIQGKSVTDSSGSQQDSVEQILIRLIAITEALSGVEEKGDWGPAGAI